MVRHRKPRGLRLRSLFLWHRYLGLSAGLFVLALAVTGLLINYSGALHLDRRHVAADWLLDWYGIPRPAQITAYPAAGHWIAQAGERLYFDGEELDREAVPLHGAVPIPEGVAVAGGDQLLLLNTEGVVIDRLGSLEGVPSGIERLGSRAGQLVVHTPQGDYSGNTRTLAWQSTDGGQTAWARAAPLPAPLEAALVQRYRGEGVSWERVLLDAHSGRVFGPVGVLVVNLASVLMVLLAITGLWHFFRRKRR